MIIFYQALIEPHLELPLKTCLCDLLGVAGRRVPEGPSRAEVFPFFSFSLSACVYAYVLHNAYVCAQIVKSMFSLILEK
ncbi:hypothetical protein Phum_PHUM109090 [Pediculus humanus corporis]|uniref:Uncharacterized protein n=1 Tax=Pediculus humanus subsp. corporis TaxID=121224 RepID=E0VDB5_PEDHC|nr:uncharacterized protein Phum_PHUM109090 [Pediculus humanus corporis]EEB11371.1 hypothetical protein Phum_PHUM109090 [Pediculus humanus corporis]